MMGEMMLYARAEGKMSIMRSCGVRDYVLMTASIDGQVILWDTRVNAPGYGVGRLWMSERTPPWCVSACWSADGAQIYAGRRNGTVDVWDVRQTGRPGTPRILKTLRNPVSSGVVSCVVAFPDGRHLAWYVSRRSSVVMAS